MRYFIYVISAVFFVATMGCHNTEDANDKILDCLEDEYGEDEAEEMMSAWELTCEDGDDACDTCVDCVMDEECDAILDGECQANCK